METQLPLKPLLILLSGPAGSGKTTLGKQLSTRLGWTFVDADDWHTLGAMAKMKAGEALTDEDRIPWLNQLNALGLHFQNRKAGWVLACSALNHSYRQRLFHQLSPPPKGLWLKVSQTELARRLHDRSEHFFSPSLLESQLNAIEITSDLDVIDAEKTPEKVLRDIWDRLGLCFP